MKLMPYLIAIIGSVVGWMLDSQFHIVKPSLFYVLGLFIGWATTMLIMARKINEYHE